MDRNRKIIQISVIGILVNLALVGFKAFVGIVTGSVAILMDAVNNLSDALSSAVTIIGAKLAGKAPDKKHPYGYGQLEYVSSVTVAVIILLTGFTSFTSSFDKILHPEAAHYTTASLVIIGVGGVRKVWAWQVCQKAGRSLSFRVADCVRNRCGVRFRHFSFHIDRGGHQPVIQHQH